MSDPAEEKRSAQGRAGRRAMQEDAESIRGDIETPEGPLPEREMSLTDRLDDIVGRLAMKTTVDAGALARVLADSGMTREDLDIRIRIRTEEIEQDARRAEAAAREPVRDAAADVRARAAEKAEALRKQAQQIEEEGQRQARAMVHELAATAKPKEGEGISEAIVRTAYDEWQAAKSLSQHARHRLTIGVKMLQENDRLARGHMQRKAGAYARLKDALERVVGG